METQQKCFLMEIREGSDHVSAAVEESYNINGFVLKA